MSGRDFLYRTPIQLGLLVLLLVVAGAIWFFGIAEEEAIHRNSASRLDTEQLRISRMENQATQTRTIVDDYTHNLEEIERFREQFLKRKKERILNISAFLEERARARGVSLDNVNYGTEPSRDLEMDVYIAQLPLVGRYRDIRAFIDDIEGSEMFLIINEMSLEDTDSTGAVRMQLTLSTYFEGAP
jgi:Tfp pilus assembly protein PilO